MTIENPILRGFNPDPSIVRVGDDYYIATSTFEWFPGVQIHHSTDLAHWKLVTRPLVRTSQLDMLGDPNSGGIWAPCLTHADGLFWLVYTDVKHHSGVFKVTHNYVVTAPAIEGPWSEPAYLNSSGFDPSLFHDGDRKWLVNMDWEWRPGRNQFAGIVLQEFDATTRELVGPIRRIFAGTPIAYTEGPHLYRHGAYYYLVTAEGGTGHGHAVTVARSTTIEGPYEVDPHNPVLTSVGDESPLRKAGHADFVETPDGTFMVHLCSRPIGHGTRGNADGWSVLGRETVIERVEWTDDGWLRLAGGGKAPAVTIEAPAFARAGASQPDTASSQNAATPAAGPSTGTAARSVFEDDFDGPGFSIDWQSLRAPLTDREMSLTARPGYLRLFGGEPPSSLFRQSLIARRQQSFRYEATTVVDIAPQDFKHIAGLICYYNTLKYHYLYVTGPDREEGAAGYREIGIMSAGEGKEWFPIAGSEVAVRTSGPIHLRVGVDYERLAFSWSADGEEWSAVGPELDATILSDELRPGAGFTGAFVGICCQDLSGMRRYADFDRFIYRELE